MHSRDLSDREWAILAPHFPAPARQQGGQWKDHRLMLSDIFHRLRTGCPWRDLPSRYSPWQTVYDRFNALRASGRLGELLSALQLRLNEAGLIDHALYCVDGANVRASRAAAGGRGEKPTPRRAA